MISSNYENFRRIASATQKGFWKHQAIAKLDRQIEKGNKKLLYLRNLLAKPLKSPLTSRRNDIILPSFTINHIDFGRTKTKKKPLPLKNLPSTQSFFVTELKEEIKENLNYKIFENYHETQIYNQINLIPFEVKRVRPRTSNQVYVSIAKIEKEFIDKLHLEIDDNFDKRVKTGINRKIEHNDVFIQTDEQIEDNEFDLNRELMETQRCSTNCNTNSNLLSFNSHNQKKSKVKSAQVRKLNIYAY